MTYVLGVDGGNTKTLAIVARLDGTIEGVGRAGCGDIYGAASEGAALAEIERAVEGALSAAKVSCDDLAFGAFSLAGADWPEDFEFLRNAMGQRSLGREVLVVNDALGALRAGSPDGNGVAIVCGTGTATGARSPDGAVWHSSFWQLTQGAHELGDKALHAVYRAELEIGPSTSLTGRVLEFFGRETVEDVLHLLTRRRDRPTANIGGFARVLLDEASSGDLVARRIVEEHGAALGDYVVVAARRVGLGSAPLTLVLAGGVLRHPCRYLANALVERVCSASLEPQVVNSRFEPVVGALLLAIEGVGMGINETVLSNVAGTLPHSSLFDTLKGV